MKKEWKEPNMKNLMVEKTNEEITDCDPITETLIGGILGTCKVWNCTHRAKEKYDGYCYCHRDLAGSGDDNGAGEVPQS